MNGATPTSLPPNPSKETLAARRKPRAERSISFLLDPAEDWQQHGPEEFKRVRRESPAAYLKVCAMLVPREMKVEHQGRLGHRRRRKGGQCAVRCSGLRRTWPPSCARSCRPPGPPGYAQSACPSRLARCRPARTRSCPFSATEIKQPIMPAADAVRRSLCRSSI